MRDDCYYCVLKHIAQAYILSHEALMGYPLHKWFAIGHIAEAEAEIIKVEPDLAHKMRELRLSYTHEDQELNYMELIGEVLRRKLSSES